ncbi:hypothetical protein EDD85DRAFT_950468 [Armillaria nabsnona]|nr:hypothetical protein EDD85DRAFT_950468 [Armillaria nabsnona]
MAWPGDARMPLEWNMLMNDQRGMEAHPPHILNNGRSSTSVDATRGDASTVESIGPYEFTRARYPNIEWRTALLRDLHVASELGTDATIEQLAKMQMENERRNFRAKDPPVERPKPRKGKEKREYTEDDIPALRQ